MNLRIAFLTSLTAVFVAVLSACTDLPLGMTEPESLDASLDSDREVVVAAARAPEIDGTTKRGTNHHGWEKIRIDLPSGTTDADARRRNGTVVQSDGVDMAWDGGRIIASVTEIRPCKYEAKYGCLDERRSFKRGTSSKIFTFWKTHWRKSATREGGARYIVSFIERAHGMCVNGNPNAPMWVSRGHYRFPEGTKHYRDFGGTLRTGGYATNPRLPNSAQPCTG